MCCLRRQMIMSRKTLHDETAHLSSDSNNDKATDRFLNLWIHQNGLLWGRLQAISALQVAVLGGWYALFVGGSGSVIKQILGTFIAVLGWYLSMGIRELINIDVRFRDQHRNKLEMLAPRLIESNRGQGTKRIQGISSVFVWISGIVSFASVMWILVCFIYWVVCGCQC